MGEYTGSGMGEIVEWAYDRAFSELVEDSVGIQNVPDLAYTRFDGGLELHAPGFDFFDLLTWSVAISVLSASSAVALRSFFQGRTTVLSVEEVEQIKRELASSLGKDPLCSDSEGLLEAEVRGNAIAYASRILVTHGWPVEQAQLILQSMLHDYQIKIKAFRSSGGIVASEAKSEGEFKVKILFLGANPADLTQLALTREVQAIRSRLRSSQHGNQFLVEQEWAVKLGDLNAALLRHRPDIVHFSGHGNLAGELILETDSGESVPVNSVALARLFGILRRNIRCVVLNACFSVSQAEAIAEHVDCVVGMSTAVDDDSAMAFAWAFYEALGFNASLKDAFDLGCNQIDLSRLPDKDAPRLISRDGVEPQEVFLMDPQKYL